MPARKKHRSCGPHGGHGAQGLCGAARGITPTFLDYAIQADADSMSNTPPTYSWYLAGLVFKWVKANGGLAGMAEKNQAKADLLYQAIDSSNFYSSPVAKADRSAMNVPFTLADEALDGEFLAQAEARGMFNLKGTAVWAACEQVFITPFLWNRCKRW